jgi:hypothetical protein
LKLKKGAFQSLLPVKSYLLKNEYQDFSANAGASRASDHVMMAACYLYHNITVYNVPIIKATDYMFENYKHLGEEPWEIYAEVVREMWCEIGGFKKSDKCYRDTLEYVSLVHGMPIKNT